MKSFETTLGPKQTCRLKLLQSLNELDITAPRILTLPSREHICYDMFKKHYPLSSIISLEKDKEIFQNLNNIGITTENVTTNEYFESWQSWQTPFNCMFLDYYSFFNESVIKDLTNIANKDIITDNWSTIGITLSKAVRKDKDIVEDLVHNSLKTRQNESIALDIDSVRAHIGVNIFHNYKVDYKFQLEYTANDGSATMWFLILNVKRN